MSKVPLDEQVKMLWDEIIKIIERLKKLEEKLRSCSKNVAASGGRK